MTGIVNGLQPIALERRGDASPVARAAPPMRSKRCETCAAGSFDTGQTMGQCRAGKPVVAIFPVAAPDGKSFGGSTSVSAWPPVQRRQWCLEWSRIEPEQMLADAEPAGAA